LETATTLERRGAGRFTANIPDGWQQGRGAFGGLVVGLMARAARSEEPDAERRLRAVSAEIVGPTLVGEVSCVVGVVRRGSGVTTLEARVEQGGEIQARASFVYGKDRAPDTDGQWLAPPEIAPWESFRRVPPAPPAPVFAQHYDVRTEGPFPFAGSARRATVGWVLPAAVPDVWADHDVVALCDVWWPMAMTALKEMRPMATVGFALQLLRDPAGLPPRRPFVYRASLPAGAGGYPLDLRELWTADGQLVALNQQTFCLIR
jgi:acyl-CoA thioesterase